jgi:hypothetical protein
MKRGLAGVVIETPASLVFQLKTGMSFSFF